MENMCSLKRIKMITNSEYFDINPKPRLAVNCQNVVYGYKTNVVVLNNINVQIPEGKIYALLGSNGCGKTTLLRLILGRLQPKSGSIRVFGSKPNTKESNIPGPGVGYMPQNIALFSEFTIEEILKYYGIIYHMNSVDIQKRIAHLIELLNLPKRNKKIGILSGGQQRLVSMSVTLIHKPPLLILDEPTVGVDSILRCRIWQYLENLCRNDGITVIITTHYIEEAKDSANVAFVQFGQLLAQSNPKELLAKYNCKTLEDVFLILSQQKINERKKNRSINNIPKKDAEIISDNNFEIRNTTYAKRNNISFTRILALLWKGYLRLKGNPMILFLFYFIPALQAFIMQFSIGPAPYNLPVAVFNGELIPNLTKLFIDEFDGKLIRVNHYETNESAVNSVFEGKNYYSVSFSENFTESFMYRFLNPTDVTDEELESSKIKLYGDNSNTIVGIHIHTYILEAFQRFLQKFSANFGYNPKAFTLPMDYEQTIYGSVEQNYTDYLSAGIIVCVMHAIPMVLSSFLIVDECKYGHFERSFVAGVKPIELFISHNIFIFIGILTQVLVPILISFVIFDVILKGTFVDLYIILVLQGLQGMAFGLLISLIFADEVYSLIGIGTVLFTMWIVSGVFWPLEAIPFSFNYLLYLGPISGSIESLRSVMIRGWSLTNSKVYFGCIVSITYTIFVSIINMFLFGKLSIS